MGNGAKLHFQLLSTISYISCKILFYKNLHIVIGTVSNLISNKSACQELVLNDSFQFHNASQYASEWMIELRFMNSNSITL